MTPPRGRYDVVVAGGGPAGCAAAIALARTGHTVLLADTGTRTPKVGEHLVSVAGLLLDDLGIKERVLGSGHRPCHATLSAWGTPDLHATDALRDPYGHGWHLDRTLFDRRLRTEARTAGAHVTERTAVRTPLRTPEGWRLVLRHAEGEDTVRCDWLIDATGRTAALATRRGARRHTLDGLTATCLTLDAAPDSVDGCSLVEAATDGWWYTALLPDNRRLVVHFTDADLPGAAGTTEQWYEQMLATAHLRDRILSHSPTAGSAPRRAPAHSARLDRAWGDGWIAAGDAAAAFDPLSSQGILTALTTGLAAAQALDAHLRGDPTALTRYGQQVDAAYTAYLHNHRIAYRQETRWADHPFWARRHLVGRLTDRPNKQPLQGVPA
ncbi:NAD(P)/FAD-dependent oxidoreductase [Streptomyces altiplanensis]